jgi:inositol-phosphate transport system ATP-binding protein
MEEEEIQGRENLYDIKLKDGNLLRSIQSANVSPLSPGTKVDWGVNPEQLFFFDNSGKRL